MFKAEEYSNQALKIMLSFVVNRKAAEAEALGLKKNFDEICKAVEFDEGNDRTQLKKVKPSDSLLQKRIFKIDDPTLIIKIGGFAFRVNMEILELYSTFFKKYNHLRVIILPESEISPTAFVAIYEWMLAENPGLPRKGIVELYKAALCLGVHKLLAQFWECISNPLINEDRAYLMYLEALAFEVPEVRKTMLNRISKFFLHIVSCEEFLHIPQEDLKTLLRSNMLSVNSELEIYYACVRYFNYDWEERSKNLVSIMKLIRYDFLPTNFVLELLNQDTDFVIKEVSRIVDHPELQDMLRDLMHYHCLSAFPGPSSIVFDKSVHRNWVFDPQCNYHSRENPWRSNPEFVPYMEFVTYLGVLNLSGAKHWESFEPIEVGKQNFEKTSKWEVLS